MKRLVTLAVSVALVAAGAYLLLRGQSAASIDASIKSSWASAAPDWQARLVQDETQKVLQPVSQRSAQGGGRRHHRPREGDHRSIRPTAS